MEGRRFRRFGRVRNQTLLPLRTSTTQPLSNTISCWYCDFKVSSLNDSLYTLGQRHARFLKVWFAVGTGFSLSALLGVTMILMFESVSALFQFNGRNRLSDLFSNLLFGLSPSGIGYSISFSDLSFLLISTLISVAVHEFGHAVAAASEGIQIEYIAVFLAILFPGALVAFDDEVLEMKPRSTVLRVYCAGIWHNAVLCAAGGLTLLLLPLLFSPAYACGSPMVLHVSSTSPVSAYLSPGDVMVSLDGLKIQNARDWTEAAALIEKQSLLSLTQSKDLKSLAKINGGKGFCTPSSMVKSSASFPLMINQSTCPDELTAFAASLCSSSSGLSSAENQKESETMHCIKAADVVKRKRCDALEMPIDSGSDCGCSEDEMCLFPVPMPGIAWIEIVYENPYSQDCLRTEPNVSAGSGGLGSVENCYRRFLYAGDVVSMAESVSLVAFQPRFGPAISAYIPYIIEKLLTCMFQVSLTLALLNSLPVYFLDGESILDLSFCYITFLSHRRRLLVKACLLGGTLLTSFVFLRTFLLGFW